MITSSVTRERQLKIFLTCWLIFVLHFATDIVREHYLAFSLVEDCSFRVDRYAGLHVDIFEQPGYGAHITNNPGVSILGAIPYWIARPVIQQIARRVKAGEEASGRSATAVYNDPRPRRVEFYRKVRERGLDIQFGLAAGVMQAFMMAPLSALAAVVMFRILLAIGLSSAQALLFALLFALGTPIFFRTAFVNQNLLIAHLALFGFAILWQPGGFPAWREERAWLAAGGLGGFSLLSDYSGVLVLVWLWAYAVWRTFERGRRAGGLRCTIYYVAGAAVPVALLLFYQWRSFGSPWYPAQHYMRPVEGIEVGYQGFGGPQLALLAMLLFDSRFGLFVVCPILVLGLFGFVHVMRAPSLLPRREAAFLMACSMAFVAFFSAVQYTRMQWVTGIRYLLPIIPCLFLLMLPALLRLPSWLGYIFIVVAFAESWCLSMVRATYVTESITRVFLGGFQLPWMTVLAKMAPQYAPFMATGASPLPLFALAGVLLYGLWSSGTQSQRH